MGFLSSLFGTKQSKTPSSTVVQSAAIPKEMSPFITEILGEAQDIYQTEKERGYSPYGGQTIAELTPDQEAALTGLAGLRGTTAPFLAQAAEAAQGAAASFTPETAQQYMSPYQQAVIDVEKREADRAFDRASQVREAQAAEAGAGSIMGSRAAIEASEAARNQQQLLSDIQTRGQQRAFESAQKQFETERARQRGFGQDIAGLGTQLLQSDISELGAQKTVGEERQAMAQTALDEAYYRFLEEQQFPQTNLAQYSGTVYGNPFARTFDQTKTSFSPQPSTGQSLLSLGLTGIGLAGGFGGGGNIFAPKPAATGGSVGGLSGLPVVRRQQGSIGNKPVNNDPSQSVLLRDLQSLWNRISNPTAEGRAAKRRGDIKSPISAIYGGSDTAGAKPRLTMMSERMKYPFQTVDEREKSIALISEAEKDIEIQKSLAGSETRPDLIVDPTADVPELVEGGLEIDDLTDVELAKFKTGRGTQASVDSETGGYTYVNGQLVPKDTTIVDKSKGARGSEIEGQTPTDPSKKLDISPLKLISDTLEGVEASMGESKKLKKQLRDAQKADQGSKEGARNKRNELNFWRAFVTAGEAVGKADPSKGVLNAIALGAAAGGKEYLDNRLKIMKEAEGDGQNAINAIKTNILLQDSDTKLLLSAGKVKAEQMRALAAWIKNSGLKKMDSKTMAELIKNAKIQAGGYAENSQDYRNAYTRALTLSILAYEKTDGDLSRSIAASLVGQPKRTNPKNAALANNAENISKNYRGRTLSPALTGKQ